MCHSLAPKAPNATCTKAGYNLLHGTAHVEGAHPFLFEEPPLLLWSQNHLEIGIFRWLHHWREFGCGLYHKFGCGIEFPRIIEPLWFILKSPGLPSDKHWVVGVFFTRLPLAFWSTKIKFFSTRQVEGQDIDEYFLLVQDIKSVDKDGYTPEN